MAITPIVTFPTTQQGYSTNLQYQTIKGTCDEATTSSILVNGSSGGVSYASGDSSWIFTVMLDEGTNTFAFQAKDNSGLLSSSNTLTVTYTTEDDLNLIVSSPTGITLARSRDAVKISIIQNSEPEVIGYNFYGSEEVGGGTEGYTLLNSQIITTHDFFKENNVVLSETVETSGSIRTTYTVEQIDTDYYYSYTHNRITQPLGTNPLTELNHYVTTAVAYDTGLQQQVESVYSSELGAAPLLLDTSLKDLPLRTTLSVQDSYIKEILDTDSLIDVKPGTITRDIHINPPSDEFERLYIIQDFMHRSQSFLTLLPFDDANEDGISDDVLTSPLKLRLKEALLLPDSSADEVQTLIDDAFDKLSGNVNIKRKQPQNSLGQALFYTRKTPTKDVTINSGAIISTLSDDTTEAIQFSVLTDFTLPYADLQNYYNSTTARYEVTLDIQAVTKGSSGNVDAEKILLIVSGVDSVFGVINPNPTEFGQDLETNNNLAQRAILAFVSVDAGTKGGYLATTLGTPNVQRAKIITAGEDLMQRDLDPVRNIHTYGKVDIYVQGSLNTQYTDTFGFTYYTVKNARALIQSVSNYQFRVENTSVTTNTPIFAILEIKNVSKSATYDVSTFSILGNGNVIDLDETNTTNIVIGLSASDVIQISYRYRDSDPYIFLHQPVSEIVSVVGESSGTLTSSNYYLQKLEDPLSFGNSTSSQDQMSIIYANSIPTGDMISSVDESHILTGENSVSLSYYGVDTDTIVVTDSTNTTTYVLDTDYTITEGDMSTLTTIKRTSTSSIPSGSEVYVDYEAGENFTVTYNVNTLLQSVQNRIDTMRHLTADVVVKGAIKTYINFIMTVVLETGSDQTSVDRKIRTAIAKLLSEKQIGSSIYQSDVIRVIEEVIGVDHVEVPFTKMVKADNSIVIRELLSTTWTAHQTSLVTSYLSAASLSWPTTENGGDNTFFRGVFENDVELTLVSTISSVAEGPGRAYIAANGQVYLSPKLGDINNATITVTYLVESATGARDISFSDIEYGAVGDLVITYDFI